MQYGLLGYSARTGSKMFVHVLDTYIPTYILCLYIYMYTYVCICVHIFTYILLQTVNSISIYISFRLLVCASNQIISPSTRLAVCPPSIYRHVYLSICPSVLLSVCLSVSLSIYLSIHAIPAHPILSTNLWIYLWTGRPFYIISRHGRVLRWRSLLYAGLNGSYENDSMWPSGFVSPFY